MEGFLQQELLFAKCHIGDSLTVEALLEEGTLDTEIRDDCGNTPLHIASMEGRTPVVTVLINHEADTCALNKAEMTPLLYAAQYNHVFVMKRLMAATDDPIFLVNKADMKGCTPIIAATEINSTSVVNYLLSLDGICLDATEQSGKTALHAGVIQGNLDIVNMLLEAGANPNISNHIQMTPLMSACIRTLEPVVDALIHHGADVNCKDSNGDTALKAAVRMYFLKGAQSLVEAGALLDICDQTGCTPVMWAARFGRVKMVDLLIKAGCDVTCKDSRGRGLLHYSALYGWTELVELLLLKGLDPDMKSNGGRTPIFHAVCNNHAIIVKLLLDLNCDVETGVVFYGEWASLLTLALERGRRDVSELLHKAGCNLRRADVEQIHAGLHPLSSSDTPDSAWIDAALASPRSLLSCCRLVVRRSLGRNLRDEVKCLPIPSAFQHFLLLDGILSIEEE